MQTFSGKLFTTCLLHETVQGCRNPVLLPFSPITEVFTSIDSRLIENCPLLFVGECLNTVQFLHFQNACPSHRGILEEATGTPAHAARPYSTPHPYILAFLENGERPHYNTCANPTMLVPCRFPLTLLRGIPSPTLLIGEGIAKDSHDTSMLNHLPAATDHL